MFKAIAASYVFVRTVLTDMDQSYVRKEDNMSDDKGKKRWFRRGLDGR